MIGIGIDTGGTCTDAVIYDLEKEKVLGRGKAPTTHRKLALGIEGALNTFPQELLKKAEFLSLSTTLATNACVEGKGGRAKLIFLGVEYRTVEEMYKKYGLPHPDQILFFDPEEADWKENFRRTVQGLKEYDSVAIVQIFPQRDGGKYEKEAKKILEEESELPCICGNELFQERNVLRRGAGTLLNAQLIPVIRDFISEVKHVLKRKNMDIPIIVVRSDGSVMSLEFAEKHPVETLLCGPAASVMAGVKLAHEENALIVDMGGTTTDIAVVEDGQPVLEPSGICIGSWKTFVKGLYVKTFGLGGDSAVRYENKQLYLDERRVIPLCFLAEQYPCVVGELKKMKASEKGESVHFLHEFYLMLHDIEGKTGYTKREYKLCRALKDGPLIFTKAAEAMGCDPYMMRTERLEQEGIVIRCGLTPTDIMHIRGDFCLYNTEASKIAAEYAGMCTGCTVEEVSEKVYSMVEERLYHNIVKLLWERQVPDTRKYRDEQKWEDAIHQSYEMARTGHTGMCRMTFQTKAVFIGIGAPVHIFLKQAAELLGTRAVIPKEAPQANALGAVLGNVTASYKVEISLDYTKAGEEEYQVSGCLHTFETYEEAFQEAEKTARIQVGNMMEERGAHEYSIRITSRQTAPVIDGNKVFYGETLTARAAGKPDIFHKEDNL